LQVQPAAITIEPSVLGGNDLKLPTFTVRDLRLALAPLSLVRRKAVLFGIETRLSATTVMMLRWKVAWGIDPLPRLASDILKSQPRHIRMECVFWEQLPSGLVTPLFQLEESLFLASQLTWDELQARYDQMVWVDTDLEAQAFMRLVSRECAA
jgi:hypothetical protein